MGDSRPWARVVEIAAIAAIVGFVAVEILLDYRRSVEMAQAEAGRMQNVVANSMAQTFGTLDVVLDATAREVLRTDDPAALGRMLENQRRGQPFVSSLFVLDPSGRVVAHSGASGHDLHERDTVPPFVAQLAADNQRVLISAPMPSRRGDITSPWVVHISQQVWDSGNVFRGLVVAALSLESLSNALDLLRSHHDDVVGVVRRDGTLMARAPLRIDPGSGTLFDAGGIGPQASLSGGGSHQAASIDYGTRRHFDYQKVNHYPIVAYAGVSLDERLQSWARRALVESALGLLAIALVVAFGGIWRHTLRVREAENKMRLERLSGTVQLSSQLIAAPSVSGGLAVLARGTQRLIPCQHVQVRLADGRQAIAGDPPARSPDAPPAYETANGRRGSMVAISATLIDGEFNSLGNIVLEGSPSGRFTQADSALLQEIAQVASLAIQKVGAEERSRESTSQLQTVLNSMSDAVYMLDAQWRFTFLNDYARRLLEGSGQPLIGREVWQCFPEYAGTLIEREYRKAVSLQRDTDFEYYAPELDNWLHIRAFPNIRGLTVYFQDITAHKQRDEQLRQSQKLEAMGQLTGGVAHDFNNLLTVILGNAELLAESLDDNDALRSLARATAHAANRGAELTSHLLAFARRQPLNPQAQSISRLVEQMIPLLQRTLGDAVTVQPFLQPGIWPAMIDGQQFESVLLNLGINARDAMPQGGELVIRTMNIELQPIDTIALDGLPAGEYVSLMLSDSGVGMDRSALERVFDPFYTTKEAGKGSGLGLSMVHGFVKQSGGAIKIHSRPHEGTTVQIYLPRTLEVPQAPLDDAGGELIVQGRETILAVEDDPMVREFVVAQLESLGYRVYAADSPASAIAVLSGAERIDLLFTDIMMPGGMNGRELAEAAQTLRPGIRILFTSGYSDDIILRGGVIQSEVRLLKKPYRKVVLAEALRQVLGSL